MLELNTNTLPKITSARTRQTVAEQPVGLWCRRLSNGHHAPDLAYANVLQHPLVSYDALYTPLSVDKWRNRHDS